MLLQFSVSNFRAFRGRQTLNMAGSPSDKSLPGNWVSPDLPGLKGRNWVKGAAIYGANASGKSSLLEALRSLASFVGESAKTTDPKAPIIQVEPFALDPNAAKEPTAFSIVFVVDNVRYEYRVAATQQRVWHESLRSFPKKAERLWFIRNWSEETDTYTFEPEDPKGLPRNRDIEKRTLANMLYLSKGIAENRTELEPVFRWLVSHLKFLDASTKRKISHSFTMSQLEGEDTGMRESILKMLRHADLGISGAEIVSDSSQKKRMIELFESEENLPEPLRRKEWKKPQLTHEAGEGKAMPLPWTTESAGTQRLFALIGPWLDILRRGYTVCIDELETSMHPLMVRELLRLFFSEEENTKNAQIIFTTHNPLILDTTLIRRDQVWFTDKDRAGRAHLYPLSDYKPRNNESLARGYLGGRYGAVPFIPNGLFGTEDKITSVATNSEEDE